MPKIEPTHCPIGDESGPNQVLIGLFACDCTESGGHRTYHCWASGVTAHVPEH